MLDWIGAGLSEQERARIDAGLAEIRRRGTGADRQRAAYGSAGRIEDVVTAVTEDVVTTVTEDFVKEEVVTAVGEQVVPPSP